ETALHLHLPFRAPKLIASLVLSGTLLDPQDFSFEGVRDKNRKNHVFTVHLADLVDGTSLLKKWE
ncbi:hypothetical protein PHLCEN_2v2213, partial [Hermanssonia centrifuga]